MTKTPRLNAKQIITALKKAGFEVIRSKGSHRFLKHEDDRCTVVPVHAGEIIGVGLLLKILRDAELSLDEFREYLE